MRRRAYVPLALLAALFVLACISLTIAPQLVSASTKPLSSTSYKPRLLLKAGFHPAQAAGNNVEYGGGPVMTGITYTYAIFWEPTGNVSAHYNSLIKRYFRDVGSSSLYRIAHQYTQSSGGSPTNAVFAGSWIDTRTYSKGPILDSDIQREVTHAQKVNGWHASMHNLFFVFTERKANICIDSTQSECASNAFCAYHSAFGSNTLYAAMPYAASFSCDSSSGPNHDDADETLDGTSHEQMEAATDPLGNAWIDASGGEIGDKCERQFGPRNAQGANVVWNGHPYLVQKEWDNSTHSCRLTPGK
jgi:hypothetical protein